MFTGDTLRAFQFLSADLLARFAMWPPLTGSDYYEAAAPPDGPRSAMELPTAGPDARRQGDRGPSAIQNRADPPQGALGEKSSDGGEDRPPLRPSVVPRDHG